VVAFHRVLVVLAILLLATLCVALFRHGKARYCISFAAYAAFVLTANVLILLFPQHYSPEVYMVKQGIYDSLLFGMALELSVRTFSAFTGVAGFVRLLLALAVTTSTTVIFLATPVDPGYETYLQFQPGITTAGVWCLSFVGLLIVWYQIPVPTLTRAIILGFAPYLVVFTVYIDFIGRLGWGAIQHLNLLNAFCYDVVAAYWAYAAWRRD